MMIVNIIFLTGMVVFCIKTIAILIPIAIKEFKEMEDVEY